MSIQSLGVGSGLDLESLVQQLLQAERLPKQQRFNQQERALDSEISAIGQVKSKLSEFEDAVKALQDINNLSGRTPDIENPSEGNEPFTATPSNSAVPGSYQIAVSQLARGSRIETASALDGGYNSSDEVILSSGTADLTFKIGDSGEEFTITVAAGTTLSQLRDQINDDENNFGVNVNVVNTNTADGGTRLVFTSDVTGVGNDLRIINKDNNAELNKLSTTDSTETATYLTPKLYAQNAIATIDGIEVQSDTNAFEDALENIRFDVRELSDLDTNGDPIASTLKVGFDVEGLKENIETFVEKYNELYDELDRLSSYGLTEDDSDGPLAGDSTVRGILSGLSNILGSAVADSELGGLFSLGIELNIDGRLEIGSTDFGLGTGSERLERALNDNFDDIAVLFNSENGIASRLNTFTKEYTQSSGILSDRESSIKSQQDRIADDIERFERRMDSYEQTLRARYLSLDTTVAQLQNTGNALFAALGGLQNVN
ncbi:flagellar filament capping protein FliD [Glaciecola sp. 1036]|uniref:flagellar filament capping protein FliD n=1 Tax=Alteromonadaceae TaxID=72275 RepID=UPI003D05F128